MFNFIWENKPDKINLSVVIQQYHNGGRYLFGSGKNKVILDKKINISRTTGSAFINICIKIINNKFWKDTFNSLKIINNIHKSLSTSIL